MDPLFNFLLIILFDGTMRLDFFALSIFEIHFCKQVLKFLSICICTFVGFNMLSLTLFLSFKSILVKDFA